MLIDIGEYIGYKSRGGFVSLYLFINTESQTVQFDEKPCEYGFCCKVTAVILTAVFFYKLTEFC